MEQYFVSRFRLVKEKRGESTGTGVRNSLPLSEMNIAMSLLFMLWTVGLIYRKNPARRIFLMRCMVTYWLNRRSSENTKEDNKF